MSQTCTQNNSMRWLEVVDAFFEQSSVYSIGKQLHILTSTTNHPNFPNLSVEAYFGSSVDIILLRFFFGTTAPVLNSN